MSREDAARALGKNDALRHFQVGIGERFGYAAGGLADEMVRIGHLHGAVGMGGRSGPQRALRAVGECLDRPR